MNIVTRSQWGARPPKRDPYVIGTPVAELWLHHTAGYERGPSGVRAIQNFHMDTRGWNDIAYSWLYDPADRTFYEGRGPGVAGGHTKGHNTVSHALCVLGHYDEAVPLAHTVEDLAAFCRWHGAQGYGPGAFTGGHRDVGSTSCPGDNLYRLIPDINTAAQENDMTPEQDERLKNVERVLLNQIRPAVARGEQREKAILEAIQQIDTHAGSPADTLSQVRDILERGLAG